MLCNLTMEKPNVFGDFSEVKGDEKTEIPKWLTEKVKLRNDRGDVQDYLIGGHVTKFDDILETLQPPRKDYNRRAKVSRRRYPLRNDVALYVFATLYSNLKRMYSATRRAARLKFFNNIGYLFIDWIEYSECTVADSAVHLRWVVPVGPDLNYMVMENAIPKTSDFVAAENKARRRKAKTECNDPWETNSVDHDGMEEDVSKDKKPSKSNMQHYIEFGRSVDDVTLLVEHYVIIRKGKKKGVKRRRDGSNRRKFRRAINLMEVILELLEIVSGFLPNHP